MTSTIKGVRLVNFTKYKCFLWRLSLVLSSSKLVYMVACTKIKQCGLIQSSPLYVNPSLYLQLITITLHLTYK